MAFKITLRLPYLLVGLFLIVATQLAQAYDDYELISSKGNVHDPSTVEVVLLVGGEIKDFRNCEALGALAAGGYIRFSVESGTWKASRKYREWLNQDSDLGSIAPPAPDQRRVRRPYRHESDHYLPGYGRPGYKYKPRSPEECMDACDLHRWCKSFDYLVKIRECSLNDFRVGDEDPRLKRRVHLTPRKDYDYYEALVP
jgi:hypothetical protein